MPLSLPDFLRPLLARPAAIFGAGVSGDGVAALLAAIGADGVVYDAKGTEFDAAAALDHTLVVFSPGFPPEHPWLRMARAAGCLCVGELDFASLFWRGRIVAITGTNGKTTLAEFLTHALLAIGRDACATGNIGHAFSRLAATANAGGAGVTAVCEVSSFQAEVLEHFRADVTLWTNFAEDHLERHGSMEAYFAAKENLAVRSRAVLCGSSVKNWLQRPSSAVALAKEDPTPFGASGSKPPSALDKFTWIETEAQPLDPRLAGTVFAAYPQYENFLLAAACWKAAGHDPEALYTAARTFRLGRHRCARIAEIEGVTFWNDSKATNYHATEGALARFDAPVLLIAGGRAKGGDIAGFVRRIGPRVRHGFLIGETRGALAESCCAAGVRYTVCGSLEEAVRAATAEAGRGDNIILSPGFASFDMFRSYQDRGDQFERLVRSVRTTAVRPPLTCINL